MQQDCSLGAVLFPGTNSIRSPPPPSTPHPQSGLAPPPTPLSPTHTLAVNSQGPYAWVQGRRATSKVTATSGGRLTNRYAWVPGRPTRRACLGVNLPLRVPPCKHYPEEVTELKWPLLFCYATARDDYFEEIGFFGTGQTLYTNLMIWNCFGSLDSDEWIFSK